MNQSLKIRGNKAIFSDMYKNIEETVEAEIYDATEKTADDARAKVPVNDGILKGSIATNHEKLKAEVVVSAHYAPYVEFGTGTRVEVPAGLTEYALQFKGKGNGNWQDFENSMRNWIKKKGIPEEALYPIMASIWRNGIYPHPFLYPAWRQNVLKLLQKLNKAYNKEKLK